MQTGCKMFQLLPEAFNFACRKGLAERMGELTGICNSLNGLTGSWDDI